jgi:hypothetical protein
MSRAATHYDADHLQRLLEDALPEPLAGEVAEHIGGCADCRQQLESLAGNPEWWLLACSGVKAILGAPDCGVHAPLPTCDRVRRICPVRWPTAASRATRPMPPLRTATSESSTTNP